MGNKLDPNVGVKKWLSGMAGASGAYIDGINSVTVSPTSKAANDDGRYLAGCQANDAKRKANLLAITNDMWKQAAIQKGAPRLSTGANASQQKALNSFTKLYSYIGSGLSSLPQRGGDANNKSRMDQWYDYMKRYGKGM